MRRLYVHLLRFKFHIFAADSFFVSSYGVPKDLNGARRACVLGVGIERYRRVERPTTVDVRFLSCHSLNFEFKIFELLSLRPGLHFNGGLDFSLFLNLIFLLRNFYFYHTNDAKRMSEL